LAARDQSKYDEAKARFDEALFLFEEVGDNQGKAYCLTVWAR
jgi:hypothetical protein